MAKILEIDGRNNDFFSAASIDRFTTREGDEIQSEFVIEQDNISLYCLDHKSKQVIFAEMPPDFDPRAEPFIYLAQQNLAKRLIAVPYDELLRLTTHIELPEKMIFVHSHGRAGSTLLHNILNQVDEVTSFAEPFFFTNFMPIAHRTDDHEQLAKLLVQCTKLFVHPYSNHTLAFKTYGLDILSLLNTAFPAARHVFLYRNAIDTAASWERLRIKWGNPEFEETMEDIKRFYDVVYGPSDHVERVFPKEFETVLPYVGFVVWWVFCIEAYFQAYQQRIPLFTLRYEDLNQYRQPMIQQLFDYLGLPQNQIEKALRAFEVDAQAGTGLARENSQPNRVKLSNVQVYTIKDLLAQHPRQLTPDLILPGTVRP